MKQIKIDLKKLASNSNTIKEISDALLREKSEKQIEINFTKTFVASGGKTCAKPDYKV